MFNKSLMNPETLDIYTKTVEALNSLKDEHLKLREKFQKGQLSEEDNKKLNELSRVIQKLEAHRKDIWDAHSLIKMIVDKK